MQAWTPVKISDEKLELHGQAGVVQSAAPTPGKKAGDETVDVKVDATGEVVTLKLSQLTALA